MVSFSLNKNQTIGVCAPSSFVEREDIEKAQAAIEARGYKVFVHEQTFARHGQSAGTQAEKLGALHALYADKSIDAIWAAGGGNRAMPLLDDLDYNLISKNPKPLIGFSDITALLNPIFAHTGAESFHAQVFKNLHVFDQLDNTLAILSGEKTDMSLDQAEILKPGAAAGPLMGGCLSLFHYLPGTNDCPNLNGAILFLEDAGDEISRSDRMFTHMARMGVFEQIGALILGEFHDVRDTGTPFGFTIKEIALEHTQERDIPIIMNAPFGHGELLTPLPLGRIGRLDTNARSLDFSIKP